MRKFVTILLIVFILSSCSPLLQNEGKPVTKTNELSFSVLKIGQADAIIMQTKNHSVLIDCGEEDDSAEIIKKISQRGITEIDYLVITHFDKDHVGGAAQILSDIPVKNIITPNYEGSGKKYKEYVQKVEESGYTPTRLTENTEFVLDGVEFMIYPPEKETYDESDNDYSLAVSVIHDKYSFLFAGDAEKERLSEIIAQTGREYDFLKVPHHGRYNEMTEEFIKSVSPSYAVITCSDKNPAEQKTVDALKNAGAKTYFTKDGDVTVTCDGNEITIMQK